jgi:crotonobetainyl-CoA:carnitine CoA-transferase CaiB-like acyl-CoA transferase
MMSDEPIVIAEGHMREVVHAVTGPQRVVGPLVDLSETPSMHRTAAPALGQHTREVLTTLAGMTDADVDRLIAGGIVKEWTPRE